MSENARVRSKHKRRSSILKPLRSPTREVLADVDINAKEGRTAKRVSFSNTKTVKEFVDIDGQIAWTKDEIVRHDESSQDSISPSIDRTAQSMLANARSTSPEHIQGIDDLLNAPLRPSASSESPPQVFKSQTVTHGKIRATSFLNHLKTSSGPSSQESDLYIERTKTTSPPFVKSPSKCKRRISPKERTLMFNEYMNNLYEICQKTDFETVTNTRVNKFAGSSTSCFDPNIKPVEIGDDFSLKPDKTIYFENESNNMSLVDVPFFKRDFPSNNQRHFDGNGAQTKESKCSEVDRSLVSDKTVYFDNEENDMTLADISLGMASSTLKGKMGSLHSSSRSAGRKVQSEKMQSVVLSDTISFGNEHNNMSMNDKQFFECSHSSSEKVDFPDKQIGGPNWLRTCNEMEDVQCIQKESSNMSMSNTSFENGYTEKSFLHDESFTKGNTFISEQIGHVSSIHDNDDKEYSEKFADFNNCPANTSASFLLQPVMDVTKDFCSFHDKNEMRLMFFDRLDDKDNVTICKPTGMDFTMCPNEESDRPKDEFVFSPSASASIENCQRPTTVDKSNFFRMSADVLPSDSAISQHDNVISNSCVELAQSVPKLLTKNSCGNTTYTAADYTSNLETFTISKVASPTEQSDSNKLFVPNIGFSTESDGSKENSAVDNLFGRIYHKRPSHVGIIHPRVFEQTCIFSPSNADLDLDVLNTTSVTKSHLTSVCNSYLPSGVNNEQLSAAGEPNLNERTQSSLSSSTKKAAHMPMSSPPDESIQHHHSDDLLHHSNQQHMQRQLQEKFSQQHLKDQSLQQKLQYHSLQQHHSQQYSPQQLQPQLQQSEQCNALCVTINKLGCKPSTIDFNESKLLSANKNLMLEDVDMQKHEETLAGETSSAEKAMSFEAINASITESASTPAVRTQCVDIRIDEYDKGHVLTGSDVMLSTGSVLVNDANLEIDCGDVSCLPCQSQSVNQSSIFEDVAIVENEGVNDVTDVVDMLASDARIKHRDFCENKEASLRGHKNGPREGKPLDKTVVFETDMETTSIINEPSGNVSNRKPAVKSDTDIEEQEQNQHKNSRAVNVHENEIAVNMTNTFESNFMETTQVTNKNNMLQGTETGNSLELKKCAIVPEQNQTDFMNKTIIFGTDTDMDTTKLVESGKLRKCARDDQYKEELQRNNLRKCGNDKDKTIVFQSDAMDITKHGCETSNNSTFISHEHSNFDVEQKLIPVSHVSAVRWSNVLLQDADPANLPSSGMEKAVESDAKGKKSELTLLNEHDYLNKNAIEISCANNSLIIEQSFPEAFQNIVDCEGKTIIFENGINMETTEVVSNVIEEMSSPDFQSKSLETMSKVSLTKNCDHGEVSAFEDDKEILDSLNSDVVIEESVVRTVICDSYAATETTKLSREPRCTSNSAVQICQQLNIVSSFKTFSDGIEKPAPHGIMMQENEAVDDENELSHCEDSHSSLQETGFISKPVCVARNQLSSTKECNIPNDTYSQHQLNSDTYKIVADTESLNRNEVLTKDFDVKATTKSTLVNLEENFYVEENNLCKSGNLASNKHKLMESSAQHNEVETENLNETCRLELSVTNIADKHVSESKEQGERETSYSTHAQELIPISLHQNVSTSNTDIQSVMSESTQAIEIDRKECGTSCLQSYGNNIAESVSLDSTEVSTDSKIVSGKKELAAQLLAGSTCNDNDDTNDSEESNNNTYCHKVAEKEMVAQCSSLSHKNQNLLLSQENPNHCQDFFVGRRETGRILKRKQLASDISWALASSRMTSNILEQVDARFGFTFTGSGENGNVKDADVQNQNENAVNVPTVPMNLEALPLHSKAQVLLSSSREQDRYLSSNSAEEYHYVPSDVEVSLTGSHSHSNVTSANEVQEACCNSTEIGGSFEIKSGKLETVVVPTETLLDKSVSDVLNIKTTLTVLDGSTTSISEVEKACFLSNEEMEGNVDKLQMSGEKMAICKDPDDCKDVVAQERGGGMEPSVSSNDYPAQKDIDTECYDEQNPLVMANALNLDLTKCKEKLDYSFVKVSRENEADSDALKMNFIRNNASIKSDPTSFETSAIEKFCESSHSVSADKGFIEKEGCTTNETGNNEKCEGKNAKRLKEGLKHHLDYTASSDEEVIAKKKHKQACKSVSGAELQNSYLAASCPTEVELFNDVFVSNKICVEEESLQVFSTAALMKHNCPAHHVTIEAATETDNSSAFTMSELQALLLHHKVNTGKKKIWSFHNFQDGILTFSYLYKCVMLRLKLGELYVGSPKTNYKIRELLDVKMDFETTDKISPICQLAVRSVMENASNTALKHLCITKTTDDLPQVLKYMDKLVKNALILEWEIDKNISVTHLAKLDANRLTVTFSSLPAHSWFEILFLISPRHYPSKPLTWEIKQFIGTVSSEKVDQVLKTVPTGQHYLVNLVAAADSVQRNHCPDYKSN